MRRKPATRGLCRDGHQEGPSADVGGRPADALGRISGRPPSWHRCAREVYPYQVAAFGLGRRFLSTKSGGMEPTEKPTPQSLAERIAKLWEKPDSQPGDEGGGRLCGQDARQAERTSGAAEREGLIGLRGAVSAQSDKVRRGKLAFWHGWVFDQGPNQAQQFLMLRARAAANEKFPNLDVGRSASGRNIGLMLDEHVSVFGIPREIPPIAI
jgi:hypothetical protein